jgi:parallel beta-helix repeat protein
LAEDANYNQIIANNIVDNGAGAEFVNSSNNIVYHNNFIDNSVLITSFSTDDINFFDNGSEGNYWSSYHGEDNEGDGIGDTPYIINENNQDNYPIMNIIPEFPSWIIPPLFLMATLSAILFKKRLFHQRS